MAEVYTQMNAGKKTQLQILSFKFYFETSIMN